MRVHLWYAVARVNKYHEDGMEDEEGVVIDDDLMNEFMASLFGGFAVFSGGMHGGRSARGSRAGRAGDDPFGSGGYGSGVGLGGRGGGGRGARRELPSFHIFEQLFAAFDDLGSEDEDDNRGRHPRSEGGRGLFGSPVGGWAGGGHGISGGGGFCSDEESGHGGGFGGRWGGTERSEDDGRANTRRDELAGSEGLGSLPPGSKSAAQKSAEVRGRGAWW